ncbi:hypothetical protein GCM10010211_33440 [Streptomyces albospinus]|uniref:Uncharacterized protein n=1 Tax=Streptomyces albospinus TaxID=285515 RepID=A0ABQ2V2B1_9ACTN|nr:hypothetical protein GCM10010211_33440 [Streptomyces albospinus]
MRLLPVVEGLPCLLGQLRPDSEEDLFLPVAGHHDDALLVRDHDVAGGHLHTTAPHRTAHGR